MLFCVAGLWQASQCWNGLLGWRLQWQPPNLHHSNASCAMHFCCHNCTLSCPQVHALLAHLYSQNFWSPSKDIRPQQLGPCSLMLLLLTYFFSLIQIFHFFLSVLSPIVLLLKLLLVLLPCLVSISYLLFHVQPPFDFSVTFLLWHTVYSI